MKNLNDLKIRSDLTPVDKTKLLALLIERKARGLPVPRIDANQLTKERDWNLDDNGYFRRNGEGKSYDPAPGHLGFLASIAVYVSLQAGRGAGKSAAGAQKALKKIMQGKTGLVVNPDLENFKTSTWPELRAWIPWNMVISKHRIRRSEAWDVTRPFSIVFKNGAALHCRGLRDPESGRGHNVNWVWYDEARRDKTGIAWKNVCAGVRIGQETQRWITTTPAGRDHWIAAFFDRKEVSQEVYDLIKEIPELKTRPLIESFHVSLEENKKNLDPIFYASLIAQYPSGYLREREVNGIAANEEGALGDRIWFVHNPVTGVSHILDQAPEWRKRLRFWDMAASEKKVGTDPDETVGSLVSCNDEKNRFCLEHQVGAFKVWDQLKEMIRTTAMMDGVQVPIYIEQEPGSGGKNQVAEINGLLRPLGFTVKPHNPKDDGDRVMAANTWFAEAAEGKWFMVRGTWNEKFLGQLDEFPEGNHDDRITSVTGGRHSIAPIRRFSSIHFMHIGQKTEVKKEEEVKIGSWGKPTP
jgi:phage terminase large subunit-like protein